jgi:hypothetical protein
VITAFSILPPRFLGCGLELLQDHRGDLGGRVDLAVDVDAGPLVLALDDVERDRFDLFGDLVVASAHEAFHRRHGLLGVGDGLTLGDLADQTFAVVRETHDRRGGAVALLSWA